MFFLSCVMAGVCKLFTQISFVVVAKKPAFRVRFVGGFLDSDKLLMFEEMGAKCCFLSARAQISFAMWPSPYTTDEEFSYPWQISVLCLPLDIRNVDKPA